MPPSDLDLLCINTIRTLAMDAVQAANSGHPGTPMALAPLAYVLYTRHVRHNPVDPAWINRDRVVLSCGHASMLLYSTLYLCGYDVTLDDLKAFRQWDSKTPGHPETGHTPGIETTTGPLGQGMANAVGMALAESHLAAQFNRPNEQVVNHHTWFIASDGDLMEGLSHEAASLAGHLQLGRLIGCYDDNRITIDGSTDLACSDDAAQRFLAYGWHVQSLDDVNDLEALDAAIVAAKAETSRPSLIIVRSHIGYGSPTKQDTADAHGAPLGEDEVRHTKDALNWPTHEPFHVPETALKEWRKARERGQALQSVWEKRYQAFRSAWPDVADELDRRLAGTMPGGWESSLPDLAGKAMATRKASGTTLNALAGALPELVGGSADLAPSNNTLIAASGDYSARNRAGRNLRFGIREHAMGGVLNGMALHGGVMPYAGTFLIFSDYMRPAIRLAAMMRQHVIYVFTHDSIGLGEDGPTHQPVEQLTTLRTIPNLWVIRPADAVETVAAWKMAVLRRGGPVALALTRQDVPAVATTESTGGTEKGAYVLREAKGGKPKVILLATGSEVHLAVAAQEQLEADGIATRVVSVPCLEVFAEQDAGYRERVLPPAVTARLAIEAAHPLSWWRWVGDRGDVLGVDRFGASAPWKTVFTKYGITTDAVVTRARALVRPG
ncbi:MAG: transketolase [Gemmatimonadales bacterium]